MGFVLNSGNCGQDSVIESGGIQVVNIGIDIVVAAYPQIKRIFGGWNLNTAFIRYALAFGILIESCSSEGHGPSGGLIQSSSLFMLIQGPPAGITQAQVQQYGITLLNNTINNPIVCNSGARITSIGNTWGTCWNGSAYLAASGSFGVGGFSYVMSINDSSNYPGVIASGAQSGMPAWGWQDSAYCDLTIMSPDFGWYKPAVSSISITASGGMGVAFGAVETFAWTQVGRTMTVSFKINTLTLSTPAGYVINLTIPSGKVASLDMITTGFYSDTAAGVVNGLAQVYVSANSPAISIQPASNVLWGLGAASISGQITFEVN